MTEPPAPTPFVRLGFPKPDEESLAELYHENTKYMPYLREVEHDPTGAGEEYPAVASMQFAPPGREGRFALPDPRAHDSGVSVEHAIRARRTRRGFTGAPIRLAALSTILYHAYGVTGPIEPSGVPGRAAPSAGARYPLELFVVARHVEDLARGVYHYHPETHALEVVDLGDKQAEINFALFDQAFLPDAAFVLVVGAVFTRTLVKYKERGYRLILLDAGHAMQNVHLMAESMGLGAVALGGFVDDALNALVGLNGEDENVLACMAVGHVAKI